MLLSMFISFLLARRLSRRAYVLLLIPITILMSFFSAHYVDRYRNWLGPFSLSFPFYTSTFLVPPHYRLESNYGLYFLEWRIFGSTLPLQLETLAFLTSFFLLLNLAGAVLGYWISKTTFIEKLLKKRQNIFS